jgi:glutamate carboxypeptidase
MEHPRPYAEYLDWIDTQAGAMADRVSRWASVSSGSRNLPGLANLLGMLREDFASLGGEAEEVELPPREMIDSAGRVIEEPLGRALAIRRGPEAPLRVLLVGHMDTVFGADHPFQDVVRAEANVLRGPGVTDAKGGLAVMLTALEAFERSPWTEGIGWEVVVNPDVELGSPGSAGFLARTASSNHLGLVFEPAHPDGALVGARKGSGNYAVVVRGRTAHAGRNPEEGRNAIHALAEFIVALKAINGAGEGIRLNVGVVEGGEAVNVVPDLAIARFNVRVGSIDDQARFQDHFDRALADANQRDGISATVHGGVSRPPKPVGAPTLRLLQALAACARSLGDELTWRDTGGVSDGNLLGAAGLATADGLGPRGGGMHTSEEFLFLDSLTDRARLVARFLMGLGANEFKATQG